MLRQLASWSFRHRWLTLVAWVVVAVGISIAGGRFAGPTAGGSLAGSDAGKAYDLLEVGFGRSGSETTRIVVADPAGVDRHQAAIAATADQLRQTPGVVDVSTAADTPSLTAPDGTATLLNVELSSDGQGKLDPAGIDGVKAARTALQADGAQAEIAGWAFSDGTMPSSELFGVAAAAIILLIAFGSVVAMGVPLLTALLGVAGALGLVGLWANAVPTPEFASQVAAMIGLGVGIDYALLIVTRYRHELGRGLTHHDAAVQAIGTAGRAVVLAGGTVVVSLLGMLLVGLDIMRGVGITAASAVVLAVAAAVTLLPAMLAIVGRHIDRLSVHRLARRRRTANANSTATPVVAAAPLVGAGAPTGASAGNGTGNGAGVDELPGGTRGLWYRWSQVVQRHPVPAAAAGAIALLALAAPVTVMRLASSDMGNDPTGSTTRVAYDLIATKFGPGANGPLVVAIAPADPARIETLVHQAGVLNGVAAALPPSVAPNGTTALTLIPTSGPQAAATTDLVHQLRDQVIPASGLVAHVGGQTAVDVDFADLMSSRLPWFMAAVLAGSFLLLLAEFRSLLVPLKAVILNLLSIAAAYGVLVAAAQWGWGGLATPGPIEPWAPMLLFAIVFGLSMDYEVFLLTAIKERFDRTGQASGSVSGGLAGTARVITAAAAIMVFVFGSFVVSDLRALRLFGLGTAAAVLIDATIVRLVLVPATMELLGRHNWWAPRWLLRVLPGGGHGGHPAAGPASLAPGRPPVVAGSVRATATSPGPTSPVATSPATTSPVATSTVGAAE